MNNVIDSSKENPQFIQRATHIIFKYSTNGIFFFINSEKIININKVVNKKNIAILKNFHKKI